MPSPWNFIQKQFSKLVNVAVLHVHICDNVDNFLELIKCLAAKLNRDLVNDYVIYRS